MKKTNVRPESSIKIESDNISKLLKDLGSKHGTTREKARQEIVSRGHKYSNHLVELLGSSRKILRWEAIKALGEISDKDTLPLFFLALQDEDVDVRWLAAEGIISFGETGIISLLEALISNPDSFYLRKGAHHIIKEFLKTKSSFELAALLEAIESLDAGIGVPAKALIALKKIKVKKKSSAHK